MSDKVIDAVSYKSTESKVGHSYEFKYEEAMLRAANKFEEMGFRVYRGDRGDMSPTRYYVKVVGYKKGK